MRLRDRLTRNPQLVQDSFLFQAALGDVKRLTRRNERQAQTIARLEDENDRLRAELRSYRLASLVASDRDARMASQAERHAPGARPSTSNGDLS